MDKKEGLDLMCGEKTDMSKVDQESISTSTDLSVHQSTLVPVSSDISILRLVFFSKFKRPPRITLPNQLLKY